MCVCLCAASNLIDMQSMNDRSSPVGRSFISFQMGKPITSQCECVCVCACVCVTQAETVPHGHTCQVLLDLAHSLAESLPEVFPVSSSVPSLICVWSLGGR